MHPRRLCSGNAGRSARAVLPAEAKEEEQRQASLVRARAVRQGDNRGIARAGQIVKPGHGQAIAPAVARYLPAPLHPCGGGAGGEGEARSTSAITASRTAAVSVSMSLFQKRIIRNP